MKKIPKSRLRRIRTWLPGENPGELTEFGKGDIQIPMIDLASNDYLGLSKHPEIIKAASLAMNSQGIGSGSSRLITGSRPIHLELEESLAKWLGREKVFLFPSGFQANIAAVIALANRKTFVLADRFIHHSLLVGIKASGAKLKRFAHNDLNDLERLLCLSKREQPNESALVITESLFSMEGTSPD